MELEGSINIYLYTFDIGNTKFNSTKLERAYISYQSIWEHGSIWTSEKLFQLIPSKSCLHKNAQRPSRNLYAESVRKDFSLVQAMTCKYFFCNIQDLGY